MWPFFLFIFFDLIFFWVNQTFLQKTIHQVQGKTMKLRIGGAILCYAALTLLMYLTMSFNYRRTFLLGSGVYAVYEGTNYAIFQDWPLSMVALDTLWGGILFVLVKSSYKLINNKMR